MLGKVFSYSWRWITRPAQAAEDQLYEKKNAAIGFWATAIFAFLYSIAAIILYLRGFKPFFDPILPIPAESYYFWQIFFTIPWGIAAWLASSAIIHFWNYIFKRERKLADILGPMGMATVIPWFFFTLLPEMTIIPILGPWSFQHAGAPWPMWIDIIRQAIPSVWMGVLIYIAAWKVYDAKWLRALTSSILGLAVYAVMFLLFIR